MLKKWNEVVWIGLDSYNLRAGPTEGCFEHGNENSGLIKIYKSLEHDSFRIALMMEAVRTSEKSVYFNVTTQRCIPESCRTHIGIS
jgi:hypothetical protein